MVSGRLNEHLIKNSMFDPLLSAYRDKHSTETALIKVQNDILSALDAGSSAILLMLDLSAAFDTIDHDIHLSGLCNVYGITGDALDWFRSYLTGRIFPSSFTSYIWRGGGVGLLVSNAIKVTLKRIHVSPLITSFKLMEAVLTICSVSPRLIVIYRMPPSKINGLKTGTFYEEFSEYLEKLSCASGKIIILGDFNIIFLDTSWFAYKRFVDILETVDCVQHIDKPTHNSGHLLDYIITRKDSVSNVCMYLTLSVITELCMYH